MKKTSLLLVLFAIGSFTAKSQSFTDDFESYTAGSKLGPQSPNWTTWSNGDGGTEDVNVVTSAAHSGTKSIYFSSTSATGGPADVVLPFAGPHTQGIFEFKAWFKVPTSKTAYFNFQAENAIGTTWAMDCYMNADGSLQINNASTTYITSTYPQNQWFQLKVKANLSTNQWEVFVDSSSVGTFSNVTNKIASIDLFPANADASFWVDDVSYSLTPYVLPSLNAAVGSINIPNGLAGQIRKPKISVRNLGQTAITSFEYQLTHKGTTIYDSVSGVNIASLGEYKIDITEDFLLPSNNDTASLIIYNINGLASDDDSLDNTKTVVIKTVVPAEGKIVLAEEGTGTWCQWCPRGAVFMDMMSKNYEGYFAGVAVHNADPMTLADYDAAISAAIPGYPSILSDRTTIIDPSDMEADFIQRIVLAPEGTIQNGATYDDVSRRLKVSLTTTLNKDISGDYRIACVLTQDSVRGTGSGYNQSNAYANGAAGAMGGFELLANPVPASKMIYDHVARHISPSFEGYANAFGASADSGQMVTYTFTYDLPSTWNPSKMNIVGMMMDPNGATVNASATNIMDAVANGYVIGTEIGGNVTGVEKLAGPDAIHIAPNPGTDVSNIMLSLLKEANIQVEIFNMNGAKVGSKNYGMLNGEMSLPIQLSELSSGLYLVKIMVDEYPTTLKLIKN